MLENMPQAEKCMRTIHCAILPAKINTLIIGMPILPQALGFL